MQLQQTEQSDKERLNSVISQLESVSSYLKKKYDFCNYENPQLNFEEQLNFGEQQ
jgi:hypothetical protein